MLTLSAKIREKKKPSVLRKEGVLPAVLYGPGVKSLSLEVAGKEFERIYKEAGESSLITLEVEKQKLPVLIHEVQYDPISGSPIHIDFYQPSLTEEIEVEILLVFEGEAPAVKDLGGTLIKNFQEVKVKALPQNLPHEIRINIEKLKTFEDDIFIRDLTVPEGVKILRPAEEVVATVAPTEKVEEELKKPIEEKVEEVEKVEKKEKEEEIK